MRVRDRTQGAAGCGHAGSHPRPASRDREVTTHRQCKHLLPLKRGAVHVKGRRTLGSSQSVATFPVPNLWYTWEGSAVDLSNCQRVAQGWQPHHKVAKRQR